MTSPDECHLVTGHWARDRKSAIESGPQCRRQTVEIIRQGVVSESNKMLQSSSSLECVQRCLIGAIEGSARLRQGSHKCGP